MIIDKSTYWISDNNYNKRKTIKTQILLSNSLRKNNYHIIRLKNKERGKTKTWNTYTISREGVIYQHYNNIYYSDFLGVKGFDKNIISIVLENMGALNNIKNKYYNWLNEECVENNVIEKKWLEFNYWEKYSKKQIDSLVFLCNEIFNSHDIQRKCIDFVHYHKDALNFNGITFKSNYSKLSSDINPLFDIENFNKQIIKI